MNAINASAGWLNRSQADRFVAIRQFVAGEQQTELIANLDRFIKHIVPRLPREHVFFEDT